MEQNLQATIIFIVGFAFGFMFRHIRGFPITRQITGLKGVLPKTPKARPAYTVGGKKKPIVHTEQDAIDHFAQKGGYREL